MKRIAMLALALALSACGKSGAEFEGKWAVVSGQPNFMSVERNDNDFIVRLYDSSTPPEKATPMSAVLKDGKLVVSAFAAPTITYVKSTGNLVFSSAMGGYEFKRAK